MVTVNARMTTYTIIILFKKEQDVTSKNQEHTKFMAMFWSRGRAAICLVKFRSREPGSDTGIVGSGKHENTAA